MNVLTIVLYYNICLVVTYNQIHAFVFYLYSELRLNWLRERFGFAIESNRLREDT
jgi:hypothetical protein